MTTTAQPLTESQRHQLHQLAQHHNIATEFWNWQNQHEEIADSTLQACLSALGVACGTGEDIAESLAETHHEFWRQTVDRTIVVRAGQQHRVEVRTDEGVAAVVEYQCEGTDQWRGVDVADTGERHELPARTVPAGTDQAEQADQAEQTVRAKQHATLPGDLPLGYHQLRVTVGEKSDTVHLICVPDRISEHPGLASQKHGAAAQLYSLMSPQSWGMGDFATLADVGAWSAGLGADFVLINPIHAGHTEPPLEPSPYLPTTRRFIDPLYIRPEDIREAAYLPPNELSTFRWQRDELNDAVTQTSRVNRDAVWAAKRDALNTIFEVPRSPARQMLLDSYCAERGDALRDFALWCAISEATAQDDEPWPADVVDPTCDAARQWAHKLSDRVLFYQWLQWVAEDQLASAHQTACNSGMSFGVMTDMAVGVHPAGADTWTLGPALAKGVTVGAPPDAFNQKGQDWSQPPWRPDHLAASGYQAFRDLVRASVRHSGGVRIDHVMGLFRLWWIPAHSDPTAGTYVRYDHEAMVGILCLEAERAGAIVVGEDLGVVEPWVREHLADRGIMGTSVLWFEYGDHGPLPADQWRELCFATVTTHDLPPTAGYLEFDHVALRDELGLLTRSVDEEQSAARSEQQAIFDVVKRSGVLSDAADAWEKTRALHAYVASSPAKLVAWALADAVGERRTQNQPGTYREYPNWCIPLGDAQGQLLDVTKLSALPGPQQLVKAIENKKV